MSLHQDERILRPPQYLPLISPRESLHSPTAQAPFPQEDPKAQNCSCTHCTKEKGGALLSSIRVYPLSLRLPCSLPSQEPGFSPPPLPPAAPSLLLSFDSQVPPHFSACQSPVLHSSLPARFRPLFPDRNPPGEAPIRICLVSAHLSPHCQLKRLAEGELSCPQV